MKKLAAALLAILLVVSLVACDEKEPEMDAFDIYTHVQEQAKNAKSSESQMTATIKIAPKAAAEEAEAPAEDAEAPAEDAEAPAEDAEAPAEDAEAPAEDAEAPAEDAEVPAEEVDPNVMTMTMTSTIQQIMNSETDIDMAAVMNIEVMGQSIEMNMYYTGGYMYQNILGTKIKTASPIEALMEQVDLMGDMEFTREDVKDMSVADVEGGKEVSITFDGAKMNEVVDQVMGMMGGTVPGLEEMAITVSDIQFTMLVDADLNAKSQNLVFDAEMTIEGETVVMSYDMNMETISIDTLEAIEFPEDLDEYIDMTPADALPAEGEEAPAEGEEAPAEGEEAPAEGEEAPAEGEEAPAEGEETPAEGEETPAENSSSAA